VKQKLLMVGQSSGCLQENFGSWSIEFIDQVNKIRKDQKADRISKHSPTSKM
jgi:hypothetical protein